MRHERLLVMLAALPVLGQNTKGVAISGKCGLVHAETDKFSYNFERDPEHVRDFQAKLLHLFAIDHERFTCNYQGLIQRLTRVGPSKVIHALLAWSCSGLCFSLIS